MLTEALAALMAALIGGGVAVVGTLLGLKQAYREMDARVRQFEREIRSARAQKKLDTAYKFAELEMKQTGLGQKFLGQILQETAVAFIVREDDPHQAKTWVGDDRTLLIGRLEACDLHLEDSAVSRMHAMIRATEGVVEILPVKPTNRIKVDGVAIEGATILDDRCSFTVGPYTFLFFRLGRQEKSSWHVSSASTRASTSSRVL